MSALLGSACMADVAPGESEEDIALAAEALIGQGQTFWIPPRGEQTLTIYYCFENLSDMAYGRNTTAFALNATWKKYANINFVDEGNCWSAAHASSAIHVHGWDAVGGKVERFGKELAGVVNGLHVARTDQLLRDTCGTSVGTNVCFQTIVAHEFGHALGFYHDSLRSDWVPADCWDANYVFARTFFVPDSDLANTIITGWDPTSLMEQSYCRPPTGGANLSANDVAGLSAIYGATNKQLGTLYVQYGGAQNAIRFQNNSRWLQPTDTGAANVQTFVGEWERINFGRLGGAASDGFLHYGDEVWVGDRFGRFLSGRDTGDVNMMGQQLDWERFKVETIDNGKWPDGSRVQVNAPLRLRNIRWNKWLGSTTGGDVTLTTATSASELRINGSFVNR